MSETKKSFLKYPTIKEWGNAAQACKTVDELNVMAKDLKRGTAGGTIHQFVKTDKMRLAHWWLNQQMARLNCYKMGDGTFRAYSTAAVK